MLFIFDWDGTLSDSTDKIVKAMKDSAASIGLPELDDNAVRNIIGLGLPEAVKVLYPNATVADLQCLSEGYSRNFKAADQVPCDFYPGVMSTLTQLVDDGHYVTVATGKSRQGLDRVLNALQLQDFFHGSRCADETTSKPHPQMLLELLQQFQCAPQQAVMVGDTEYDMAMAQTAQMDRIAVSYGAHHIDRLKLYDPVLCLDDFSGVLQWTPSKVG